MCVHHWIITEDEHKEGHFIGRCKHCLEIQEYVTVQPRFTSHGVNLKRICPEKELTENN